MDASPNCDKEETFSGIFVKISVGECGLGGDSVTLPLPSKVFS